MKVWLKKNSGFLIILLALFAALPLLILYQQRMFWDITLINLPWRYHLSESINNGYLPLWNPYMNYGFPQMGHGETWYPVSWILALLFEYNLKVLQFEFLFNLFIAGLGFYKLVGLFDLAKPIKLSGAIAYMLCGVFIAQASHLGYLTSGAWMPFVFYFLIKFLKNPDFRLGLTLLFFYFLLATGGYPGNIIVISYICLAITLYHIIKNVRNKNSPILIKYAYLIPILSFFFIALFSVVLHATLELNPLITRGELEYTNEGFGAMTGSVTVNSFASLITPLSTAIDDEVWGTSRMLNDSYFGLIPLILSLFYLVNGRGTKHYKSALILFGLGIFFFLVSIATQFPLHKLLYNYLPMLDKFRFPSLFRIFFIFSMLIISLFGMQLLIKEKRLQKQFYFWIGGFIVMFGLLLMKAKSISFGAFITDFEEKVLSLNINNMLYVDILIGISILLLLFVLLKWNKKHLLLGVLILIGLDLVVHTWVRTPIFVARNTDPALVDDAIAKIPDGFPLINQQIATRDATSQFDNPPPLWTNKYSYLKYPLVEGSSPYSTKTFSQSIVNGDLVEVQKYPFLAVFDDFSNNKVDTVFYQKELTEAIVSTSTNPNEFCFEILGAQNKYVLFNHNMHKDWCFYENDLKLEPIIISTNFLAVELKTNKSKLEIKFEPATTIKLFYLSASSFVLLILSLAFLNIRHYKRS